MKIEKKLVTPFMAKDWLNYCNNANRKLSPQRVQSYVNDMLQGNWLEDTGESIKFDTYGTLLDGQHRLAAIVKSQKSLNLHIVTGLENSVFKVLDTGKTRSGNDALNIYGVKSSNSLASVLQKYKMLKSNLTKTNKQTSLTNTELINLYNSNDVYWAEKINYAQVQYKKFNHVLSKSNIGAFSAVFDEKNIDKSKSFFEELCTGKNITNESINVLRDKLIKDKISKVNKLSYKVYYAFIIKTWNAYVLEKEFKMLRFDENIEEFPNIL
jgi:hypothetical protein